MIINAIANSTCPAKIAKPPMTNSGVLLAKLESTPETYGVSPRVLIELPFLILLFQKQGWQLEVPIP